MNCPSTPLQPSKRSDDDDDKRSPRDTIPIARQVVRSFDSEKASLSLKAHALYR